MLNTDSIVKKRIKVFVYIPENNGSGFLNGSGFVVFAYTFLTTAIARECSDKPGKEYDESI